MTLKSIKYKTKKHTIANSPSILAITKDKNIQINPSTGVTGCLSTEPRHIFIKDTPKAKMKDKNKDLFYNFTITGRLITEPRYMYQDFSRFYRKQRSDTYVYHAVDIQ